MGGSCSANTSSGDEVVKEGRPDSSPMTTAPSPPGPISVSRSFRYLELAAKLSKPVMLAHGSSDDDAGLDEEMLWAAIEKLNVHDDPEARCVGEPLDPLWWTHTIAERLTARDSSTETSSSATDNTGSSISSGDEACGFRADDSGTWTPSCDPAVHRARRNLESKIARWISNVVSPIEIDNGDEEPEFESA